MLTTITLQLSQEKLGEKYLWALVMIEEFFRECGFDLMRGDIYFSQTATRRDAFKHFGEICNTFPEIASAVKSVFIDEWKSNNERTADD